MVMANTENSFVGTAGPVVVNNGSVNTLVPSNPVKNVKQI